MSKATAYLLVCGTFCIYPGIVATLAIFAYRRYQIGGWRAIFFGDKGQA